jgi:hypothetical protein
MTNTQTFTLLDPYGVPIMKGSMPALMEHIPDSVARNSALDDVVRIACDAVEAEERVAEAEQRVAEARACSIKYFCDNVSRLSARVDAVEEHVAQQRKDEEEQEATRLAKIVEDLAPIIPPEGERTAPDDGDLEIVRPVEKEKYGPNDDEGVGDLPPELKEDVPPPSGSYTTPDPDPSGGPGNPRQIQQPISASFW